MSRTPSTPVGPLAALSLSMLLASLGTSIANVALPDMTRAFGVPFAAAQWIVLAYLLAVTVLVVGAGRLGDALGRRRLLLAGLGVFTAASALCGAAPALGSLVAARVAQGAGAAAMMALTLAFVGAAVPPERTGRAMGLLGTMSAVGTALGPVLGGVLLAGFGWRAVFLVNLPLGLLAVLLAWRWLPADPPARTAVRFDARGAGLLALALTTYALAMTAGQGRLGVLNGLLLLVAAGAAAGFVVVEARAAAPLVRLAMLRDPVLATGFAMSMLVTTVVMATLVVGPFHLAGALGLGAAGVGLAMCSGPLVAALAGIPAGRLVDRAGARRMTMTGLAVMGAGCGMLTLVPLAFGVVGYVAGLGVLTAGYALFQAANNTAVMTGVTERERGVVSGLLTLSRNLGLVTGAALMGAVFALAAGVADIAAASAEAVASGTRATFVLATILVVIALGLAARARRAQAIAGQA